MKIDIDSAIVIALISAAVALTTSVGAWIVARRANKAQANRDEADAATKLSEAASQQVKTYNSEIVVPLVARIDTLEKDNARLSQLADENEVRHRADMDQIEWLQNQIRGLNRSIESQRQQIIVLIDQGEVKDKTIKRMQEEIEQLQLQNEVLRTEIAMLRAENDSLKTHPIGKTHE